MEPYLHLPVGLYGVHKGHFTFTVILSLYLLLLLSTICLLLTTFYFLKSVFGFLSRNYVYFNLMRLL